MEKNVHGKIFKKIRKERGIKLKDAAGSVVSVQTLRRFESDETSVSLAIFEKLMSNLEIGYYDYLFEYLSEGKKEKFTLYNESIRYISERNYSAVASLFVQELKKEKVTMDTRLTITMLCPMITQDIIPPVVHKNNAMVWEYIVKKDKLSLKERQCLSSVMMTASKDHVPIEFVRRIISEDLKFTPSESFLSSEEMGTVFRSLLTSIGFLSRNGYNQEAEKYCLESISRLKSHFNHFVTIHSFLIMFDLVLAQIYLNQDKKEGVELANKCIRRFDAMIEWHDLDRDKNARGVYVKKFYELNKTGIDFDF